MCIRDSGGRVVAAETFAALSMDPGSPRFAPAFVTQGSDLVLLRPGFLKADGTLKAAKDIWPLLEKAGVPRYAELVVFGETLGEAAVNVVVLRLMGFADVKVWDGDRS